MKTLLIATAATLLPVLAFAVTPTVDVSVATPLQPNSTYDVSADLSTTDAAALLALLQGADSGIEVLDGSGNILGEIPASSLASQLAGLTGAVTKEVDTIIQTGATALPGLVFRTIDSPLIQTSNVLAELSSRQNMAPTVRVTKKHKTSTSLRLRGVAGDDVQVTRVQIRENGHIRQASGTTNWRAVVTLRKGVNRIIVRSVDNTGAMSAPRKIRVVGE